MQQGKAAMVDVFRVQAEAHKGILGLYLLTELPHSNIHI